MGSITDTLVLMIIPTTRGRIRSFGSTIGELSRKVQSKVVENEPVSHSPMLESEFLPAPPNNSLSRISSGPSTNPNHGTQESMSGIEVANLCGLVPCRGAVVMCFYPLCRCVCWSVRVTAPARSHGRCANTL